MKLLFLSISFFCFINLYSQSNKKIYLNTLNDNLMGSIISQGKCLFEKSNCIKSSIDNYYIIPNFLAQSKIPLEELKFSSKDSLLSNLYIFRKSTRRLLVNFGWNAVNKESLHSANSDWKHFYCYDNKDYLFDYLKSVQDNLGLNNVKYIFGISGVDGFLKFIVNNVNEIFVYYSRDKKWVHLSEFNDFYQNGEIQKFDDNPFK